MVYLEAVACYGKSRKDLFWVNITKRGISVGLWFGHSNIELINSADRNLPNPELIKDIHTTVHDGVWHNKLNERTVPLAKIPPLNQLQFMRLGTICFSTDLSNSVEPWYSKKEAEVTFPIDVTKVKRGMVFCSITLCAADVQILNSIKLPYSKFTHVITRSNPWIVLQAF